MSDLILDDLELELRKLPGVRAAGFDARDELLIIQLHVVPGEPTTGGASLAATRIAARHADRPVAVEVFCGVAAGGSGTQSPTAARRRPLTTATDASRARCRTRSTGQAAQPAAEHEPTSRMRLLAVLSFPDTDELEVHLILDGRRTIGRAPASRGLVGAIDATIAAVRDFGPR